MNKCITLCDAGHAIGDWLYDWQTLVGALLAVAAAVASVVFLKKQIAVSELHERERIRRRHQAVRATLSLTLSQLCLSAQSCLRSIAELRRQPTAGRALADGVDLQLELPESVVPALRDLIETTNDSHLVNILFELITNIQVARSRLESVQILQDHDLDARMLDVAEVYALAESMFEYARRETEQAPEMVAWERVRAALRFADAWPDRNPDVHALLENYAHGEPNFWSSQA